MLVARPLEETWPLAEPAISKTCRDLGLPLTLVEVAYELCRTKKAYLYSCSESETFAIVQPRINRETGTAEMFVWCAWNAGGLTVSTAQGNAYLDELAQGMGARRIIFHSRRKGFERTGWDVDYTVYSRPVKEI